MVTSALLGPAQKEKVKKAVSLKNYKRTIAKLSKIQKPPLAAKRGPPNPNLPSTSQCKRAKTTHVRRVLDNFKVSNESTLEESPNENLQNDAESGDASDEDMEKQSEVDDDFLNNKNDEEPDIDDSISSEEESGRVEDSINADENDREDIVHPLEVFNDRRSPSPGKIIISFSPDTYPEHLWLHEAETARRTGTKRTLFFQKIFDMRTIQQCSREWARNFSIKTKNVWLIPICYPEKHWVLLIVCVFLVSLYPEISFAEWSIYYPLDNPSQIDPETGNVGGNCGVHVCVWGFLAAMSSSRKFTEADMENARIAIVNMIYYAKSNPRKEALVGDTMDKLLRMRAPPIQVSKKYSLKVVEQPPAGFEGIFDFVGAFRVLLDEEQRLRPRRDR
ncbi:hypothetical protein QAD02_013887 [Eretmocerus hayati]|uniref:Uncharacterized protein n=1 Tax=Eretmocerus hayati TaxID=131215 RepID=A0ACC2P3E4_9HYME|nr:hypothetical protein QAD02_013887 [Eretmocerus hayati]